MNSSKSVLFLRPFYGVNIISDMGGDLGVVDYSNQICCDVSILYAASLSQSLVMNTTVIDANARRLTKIQVLNELSTMKCLDEILVKATAPSIKEDLQLCLEIKEKFPNIKITIFGHIIKLLDEWIKEKYISAIDNVWVEPIEEYIYRNFGRTSKEENKLSLTLNDLPIIDYSLFPIEKYKTLGGKSFSYLWASRGCKFRCDYCPYSALFNKGIEFRDIDKIILDIKNALANGVEVIQFRDPFFTANKFRIKELCDEIIKQGLQFEWYCETYLSGLDRELLEKMYEAGNRLICIGIESATSDILKMHRRPTFSEDRLKNIVSIMDEIGIESVGFFMIGFESETIEQMYDTCDLAIRSGVTYAQFNIWTLYPDTHAFQNLQLDTQVNTNEAIDYYLPFENRVSYNPNKFLSRDELEYLSQLFLLLFNISRIGFNEAYKNYKYIEIQRSRVQRYIKMREENGKKF